MRRILISFDVDGTLEVGDPPGPIPIDFVRAVKELGHIVGSASDRVISEQRAMWSRHEVEVDFVSHKHHLDTVREQFADALRFVHIGDTDVDERWATTHGFEFYWQHSVPEDIAALGGLQVEGLDPGGLEPDDPTVT